MSFRSKGSMPATVTVSREPDRSGNFICDGTADDVQIQAAIDYAGALEGSLYIEAGIYDITAPLSLTGIDNITIRGASRARALDPPAFVEEGTHLRLADGTDDHLIEKIEVTPAKLSGITIRDLVLDGNSGNQTPAAVGDVIHLEFTKEAIIERCLIMRGVRYGIHLFGSCENNWIINNRIEQTVDGVHCVYIENSITTRVVGNVILGAADTNAVGVHLFNSAVGGQLITHNMISDCYYGIRLNRNNNNIITDNQVFDHTSVAIVLTDTCLNNTISKNVISSPNTPTPDGIRITDYGTASEFNLVVDNQIFDCSDNGIELVNLSNRNVVRRNILQDNGGYGIDIQTATVTGSIIKDNVFDNNTSGALNDTGTDTVLATVHCQLTQAVGGAALKDGAWAAPNGVDVDAATEGAVGTVWLPLEVQQVVRIIIYGWSNVIEATNNMLLNVYIVGGSSSEQWNAESIDVGDVPSEETGGIIANDVLHWVIDATDDANIADLIGGDLLHCAAVGEGASAPDIATDAVFGDCIVEYV